MTGRVILTVGLLAVLVAATGASGSHATAARENGQLGSKVADASGPVDLDNGGNPHESVGQVDTKPLARGRTYTASTFPLPVNIRPPDALWEGVQLQSGRFRFVQLHHLRAGNVPLHGRGFVTLEAGVGRTESVAATVKKLRSTPLLQSGAVTPVRVAGFRGKSFDATIVGTDRPKPRGVSLAPFTQNRHCGFCNKTMKGETQDYKFGGEEQLFRIMVISVRGKTVVIYLESSFADSPNRKYPPTKMFPTFVPFAQKLLATLTFPR